MLFATSMSGPTLTMRVLIRTTSRVLIPKTERVEQKFGEFFFAGHGEMRIWVKISSAT